MTTNLKMLRNAARLTQTEPQRLTENKAPLSRMVT